MIPGRHVGGDRSRNGLPEFCSGYVYRGSKPGPELHPPAAARKCPECGHQLRSKTHRRQCLGE